ncbi:hypothetical protein EHW99_0536 [Erwinia amylovora]|uniref:Uncharacterized protein n=3 Tax=Erwinia amylovora TaxID=552 RepID=A0A831A632_ERWAM|nr:hypothetical protein EaACW_3096 [Erwinia amylovora ACW56400]QJQ53243.1 hypothetical protein EHX00_0536 [Erwinia amylovora]CBA22964.1 hypothetical protein predicted by Glimmer/Critica [Erwinia amylovora CFBP1430]CBX81957.1 hypothetical protein predicted by Glimmer/Critica [Erwinia amylovora ATCC BAA-2158]CCO79936.1 hypothetical protein BN432_3162 [Erwinia amylovora Ea356]CCO83741.1 hypothetical protein BN433_3188 [Erwinia amylovora Ea266]CCO87502.1 hypothetical protein BN434_3137 [Erwinia a
MALGQLKPWLQRGQASYLRGDYTSSAGMAQYLLSNLAGKTLFIACKVRLMSLPS